MKWSIVVLIIFGLLAALSASFLVSALRKSPDGPRMSGKGDVDAVVAVKTLAAMSLITPQDIIVKKVPKKGLAVNHFSEPYQVIGRVLGTQIKEGHVLTGKHLITRGGGAELAATLQPGMRAVSVPVSVHSVMGGMLYSGCFVDVIATFRLRQDERGQAISTTLLHGVQVLTIQNASVVSDSEKGDASRSGGQLTVTLMVDTKQAEALQLAMDNGKISLAMRNPTDQRTIGSEGMVLNQGRLGKYGELLGPSVQAAPSADSNGDSSPSAETDNTEQLRRLLGGGESGGRASPQWQITVIRGKEVKEEVTAAPEAAVTAREEGK
jgi:pilus assembly protein CpaB